MKRVRSQGNHTEMRFRAISQMNYLKHY